MILSVGWLSMIIFKNILPAFFIITIGGLLNGVTWSGFFVVVGSAQIGGVSRFFINKKMIYL